MANGRVPSGKSILHRCDNPRCVRPDHLYAGTPLDNMIDRRARGRQGCRKGSAHQNSKLDEATVVNARRLFSEGAASIGDLASAAGVHYQVMVKALHRLTWKHC